MRYLKLKSLLFAVVFFTNSSFCFSQMIPFAFFQKADSPSCSSGSQTFSVPGASSFNVPAGCTSITIEIWGGGGGGATAVSLNSGGGGGGGARAIKTRVATPGETINYTIGVGGALNTAGSATTADGMTANGGDAGTAPTKGNGGTATGGDTNQTGGNGVNGVHPFGGAGGAGATGGAGGGGGSNCTAGTLPGGAGSGGGFGQPGCAGAGGRIKFTY